MKAWQISSLFVLILFILPLHAQTSSQSSIVMPTVPTISAPTAPTVTYPSDVTLSSDVSPYTTSSFQESTTESTASESSSSNLSSSTPTDSEISSLAASALQQLSGSSSFDTSALTDALLNSTSTSLQNTDLTSSTANTLPINSASITENVKSYGSILRCNIDNFNQIGAFKQFWISKPETNGAFLFTGTYINQNTTDTFYMYFIPDSSTIYNVSVSNTNEKDTVFSTLGSLSKTIPLTARRTGNLVAINLTSSAINIDMLLSINF